MAYTPYPRSCLLIPFNDKPHLFVVLNPPSKDGDCLLVMISSIREGKPHDKSCVLEKGDHAFIDHASYVVYRIADIARSAHISNMVERKYYVQKDDVSAETYQRILEGLAASEDVPQRIVQYARNVKIIQ